MKVRVRRKQLLASAHQQALNLGASPSASSTKLRSFRQRSAGGNIDFSKGQLETPRLFAR